MLTAHVCVSVIEGIGETVSHRIFSAMYQCLHRHLNYSRYNCLHVFLRLLIDAYLKTCFSLEMLVGCMKRQVTADGWRKINESWVDGFMAEKHNLVDHNFYCQSLAKVLGLYARSAVGLSWYNMQKKWHGIKLTHALRNNSRAAQCMQLHWFLATYTAMSRYWQSVVVCLSSVTFVYCGQTVPDRPMVTMEHYWEVNIGLSEFAETLTFGDIEQVISRSRKWKWPVSS